MGTPLPQAAFRPRIEFSPDGQVFRQAGQFGAVAGGRRVRPLADDLQMTHLIESGQASLFLETREPIQAQVVVSSLEQYDPQLTPQRLFQARDVVMQDLLLKVFRRRRDDDDLIAQDGRDEISQRLASARAGLDTQVSATLQGIQDGTRHLQLAGAKVKAGLRGGQQSAVPQHGFQQGQRVRWFGANQGVTGTFVEQHGSLCSVKMCRVERTWAAGLSYYIL